MALLLVVAPAETSGNALFPLEGKCHTPFPSVAIHNPPFRPSAKSFTIISGTASDRLKPFPQTVNTPASFPRISSPFDLAKRQLHWVKPVATRDNRPVRISYLYKPRSVIKTHTARRIES